MKKYEQLSEKQVKQKGLLKVSQNLAYVNTFIKQNVYTSNIRHLKFIENDTYISHGIYYVKQNDDNVFFVYPTLHTDKFTNETIICANHFSFPLNKQNVDIHVTQYVPVPDNLKIGQVYHLPRVVLPDHTKLPLTHYNAKSLTGMGHYSNEILDICRAYMRNMQIAGGFRNVVLPRKINLQKQRQHVQKSSVSSQT